MASAVRVYSLYVGWFVLGCLQAGIYVGELQMVMVVDLIKHPDQAEAMADACSYIYGTAAYNQSRSSAMINPFVENLYMMGK